MKTKSYALDALTPRLVFWAKDRKTADRLIVFLKKLFYSSRAVEGELDESSIRLLDASPFAGRRIPTKRLRVVNGKRVRDTLNVKGLHDDFGWNVVVDGPMSTSVANFVKARTNAEFFHRGGMGLAWDPPLQSKKYALYQSIHRDLNRLLVKYDVAGELKKQHSDKYDHIRDTILETLYDKYGLPDVVQALKGVTVKPPVAKKRPVTGPGGGYKFAFDSDGPRSANALPLHPDLEPEKAFELGGQYADKYNSGKRLPKGRRIKVDLTKLVTLQPTIDNQVVTHYSTTTKPLKVAKIAGRLTLVDGNHCANAQLRRGEQIVPGELVR